MRFIKFACFFLSLCTFCHLLFVCSAHIGHHRFEIVAKKLVDRNRNEWDDISETADMRSSAGKEAVSSSVLKRIIPALSQDSFKRRGGGGSI